MNFSNTRKHKATLTYLTLLTSETVLVLAELLREFIATLQLPLALCRRYQDPMAQSQVESTNQYAMLLELLRMLACAYYIG